MGAGGPKTAPALPSGARRGGRAVECAGLENRYGLRVIGGSNPPLSALQQRVRSCRTRAIDSGAVTQLVECQLCKLEVDGSSPFRSIDASDRAEPRKLVSVGDLRNPIFRPACLPLSRVSALIRSVSRSNRCAHHWGSAGAPSVPVAASVSLSGHPTPGSASIALDVSLSPRTV